MTAKVLLDDWDCIKTSVFKKMKGLKRALPMIVIRIL
jgi:hypothetical protein